MERLPAADWGIAAGLDIGGTLLASRLRLSVAVPFFVRGRRARSLGKRHGPDNRPVLATPARGREVRDLARPGRDFTQCGRGLWRRSPRERGRGKKRSGQRGVAGEYQPNHLIGYPKTKMAAPLASTQRRINLLCTTLPGCLGKQGAGMGWILASIGGPADCDPGAACVAGLLQVGGEDPGQVSEETGGAGRGHSGLGSGRGVPLR